MVSTTVYTAPAADLPAPVPRTLVATDGLGDRLFRRGSMGTGLIVLSIMVAVGLFLSIEAAQALRATGTSFITTAEWQPDRNEFGIAAVLIGTVAIAFVAVAVAMPVSIGTALFIAEVAPPRVRSTLVGLVDLMAAVPSVVYGLWGLFLFQGQVIGVSRWLSSWFSWIPFFEVSGADPSSPLASETVYTASTFIAGLVVALMVMPIQCSIMREVFAQVPVGEREGAFALGATRWGMIRVVSIPFARGGIIGGTMLGLGRALGETIAVLLIISPRFDINFHVLEAGGNSVSSLIALRYSEASGFGLSALMAAGLALFAMTLVVNFTASAFVARIPVRREQRGLTVTDMLRRSPTTVSTPSSSSPATVLAAADGPAPAQVRRRLGGVTSDDLMTIGGAFLSALCTGLLLFGRLAPVQGVVGFMVVTYVIFVGTYALLVSLTEARPVVVDKVMSVLLSSAAAIAGIALVSVIGYTLWRGRAALGHLNLYYQDMSEAGPADPVSVGGIGHAIVGTLIVISLAMVLTVPLGIACAVYLNETQSRLSGIVRTVVDAMTALPSILAGLFIFATWILILGFERSGLAAAIAVSIMMLPIIIRSADVVLRLVPGNLREASAALGAPKWKTVRHVVLPTARSGLATAVILGVARGVGETAPVLLTAGFASSLNTNPVEGPMVSLPLATFEFVRSGREALIARGFATAAVLMVVVLILFVIARILGGHQAGHVTKRQARRLAARSARDVNRFETRHLEMT